MKGLFGKVLSVLSVIGPSLGVGAVGGVVGADAAGVVLEPATQATVLGGGAVAMIMGLLQRLMGSPAAAGVAGTASTAVGLLEALLQMRQSGEALIDADPKLVTTIDAQKRVIRSQSETIAKLNQQVADLSAKP